MDYYSDCGGKGPAGRCSIDEVIVAVTPFLLYSKFLAEFQVS